MSESPRLEVLCPVRNSGSGFVETLNSLGKVDGNLFVTISDNHSSDGSPWRQALPLLGHHPYRLMQPPEPLGRVEHWNWLSTQATCPFVKLAMASDCLRQDSWTRIAACFGQHAEVVLVSSLADLRLPGKLETMSNPDGSFTAHDHGSYLRECVSVGNFLGSLTAVTFRRESLLKALPFDPAHPWTADWRLYSTCSASGPVGLLRAPLVELNRTSPRLSTSLRGVLHGLHEEWAYSLELARRQRLSRVVWITIARRQLVHATAIVGRRVLPRRLRQILGAVYRSAT